MFRWHTTFVLVLAVALTAATAGPAVAGGHPTKLYFVGQDGQAEAIDLNARTGDSLYVGPAARVPQGEYVALFPVFFGLTGAPLRYYAAEQVLCSGRVSARRCTKANAVAQRVLAPAAAGRAATGDATVITALTYRGKSLRLPNVGFGLELALSQEPSVGTPPMEGTSVQVRWKGPNASARPEQVLLSRDSVLADGQAFALLSGVSEYLNANLPQPDGTTTAPSNPPVSNETSGSRPGSQSGFPGPWQTAAIGVAVILLGLGVAAAVWFRLRGRHSIGRAQSRGVHHLG